MRDGYVWLNDMSQQFLESNDGYLLPKQTLDQRIDIICNTSEKLLNIKGFSRKLKENIKKGWYSISTPILANFGTDRGLPISCFGSYLEDKTDSVLYAHAEVGMMTKYGGGTSAYFGNLRPRGSVIKDKGFSSGSVHFMSLFESVSNIISQGGTRRGSFAAYLPIDHKDIDEFLLIRSEGFPIQDISFGVTVPDYWMKEMISGDKEKRTIWSKVLESRANKGYPYIMYSDNVNNNSPDVYQDKGMTIVHSNLCAEIALADNKDESFVCDLSSMNLLHYDEWKDTDAVEILTFFLDSVMTEFIEKAADISFMKRSVNFAKKQRAIGIGALGWHSYLQSKLIPFDSFEAKLINTEIFKTIKEKSLNASKQLAKMFGEPEYLIGYGRRNMTTMAIAPTKSSAFILGQVSEGIEPHKSNYYIKDLAKGKFTIKNTALKELLIKKDKDNDEVWGSILKNSGSVQHLDFLSEKEKSVFKTFSEISPREIIIQAASRQKFIDQSQSLNLMIHPSTPIKDVNSLYILAWELGIKTLYYQFSVNAAKEFNKSILECSSCSA